MSTKQIEYCDIVMKGGIASGIVYPNAVLALATRYTFKNIGGTSAGAIAAAACAAAALGERRKLFAQSDLAGGADEAGFKGLASVADQLKQPGFIFGLFQPEFAAAVAGQISHHALVKQTTDLGQRSMGTVETMDAAPDEGDEDP